jgi:hypothetical protein
MNLSKTTTVGVKTVTVWERKYNWGFIIHESSRERLKITKRRY